MDYVRGLFKNGDSKGGGISFSPNDIYQGVATTAAGLTAMYRGDVKAAELKAQSEADLTNAAGQELQGKTETAALMQRLADNLAKTRVKFGAGGADVMTGSARQVIQEKADEGFAQIGLNKYKNEAMTRNLRRRAARRRARASLAKQQGVNTALDGATNFVLDLARRG